MDVLVVKVIDGVVTIELLKEDQEASFRSFIPLKLEQIPPKLSQIIGVQYLIGVHILNTTELSLKLPFIIAVFLSFTHVHLFVLRLTDTLDFSHHLHYLSLLLGRVSSG